MTNLDEVNRLQTALKAIVARYEKKNPIRPADFHGDDCGCYRCAVDGCNAAVNALPELIERVERLEGALKGYQDALDPDQTKAAYIGEFGFYADNPEDDENDIHVDVPWTVIKAIMAAISGRAKGVKQPAPDDDDDGDDDWHDAWERDSFGG